ncbi:MAG: glycine zipper 2TM domain-containing protein [Pedobacter sp.]|nr:MAG: glycine zipper 2TM domain-containing protein [Pedobacter sp.]
MKKYLAVMLCAILSLALVGCGSHNTKEKRYTRHHTHDVVRHADNYGVVTDIDRVKVKSKNSGGGAVLGAVVGGVIGHQMGSGRGTDVATGVGVVGGAVAGSQIEKRRGGKEKVYGKAYSV